LTIRNRNSTGKARLRLFPFARVAGLLVDVLAIE